MRNAHQRHIPHQEPSVTHGFAHEENPVIIPADKPYEEIRIAPRSTTCVAFIPPGKRGAIRKAFMVISEDNSEITSLRGNGLYITQDDEFV